MNRSIRPIHPSPSWALAALLLLGCETTPPDGTPVDAGADVPTADAGSVPPTDAPAVDGSADVPTAACAPLALILAR